LVAEDRPHPLAAFTHIRLRCGPTVYLDVGMGPSCVADEEAHQVHQVITQNHQIFAAASGVFLAAAVHLQDVADAPCPSRKTRVLPAIPGRCAIYTRKCTEEGLDQDFNSLDAQREAAEAYIQSQAHAGWACLPARYDDGGYSGSNLDRPALQRLLADIQARQIDCVLTNRVDRLSHSLLDYARLMELFEEHQVAFVSMTQHFHSGTSMGRLVLNVLLSFAQFERELIAERTRDKVAAARRKGKCSGGVPVLGYDVDARNKKLVVNAEEAFRVRAIFDLYREHRSLLPVVEELARRGWCTKQSLMRQNSNSLGFVSKLAATNDTPGPPISPTNA
jgi:DNA invertase Pin-like site-specific DNA recombinase